MAITWKRGLLVGPNFPRLARDSTSRTLRARSGMRGAASACRREDTVVEPFFGTWTPETKGEPWFGKDFSHCVKGCCENIRNEYNSPAPAGTNQPITLQCGGRYWVRTSDLFRVKEARYRCANRPRWVRDSNPCIRLCRPLPRLSANPPREDI